MPQISQAELAVMLERAVNPDQKLEIALTLLQITSNRQYIDYALHVVSLPEIIDLPGKEHRAILREKAQYYFDHSPKDKAGMIREKIIRLLVHNSHPDDLAIYIQGVTTYYRQPVTDVAQNLRAAALVGLAALAPELACIYAVKLIGEDDTSQLNCEPSITAISILHQQNKPLPIYQFILLKGHEFIRQAKGEAVSKAMESLGEAFPLELYVPLAREFIEMDATVVEIGIVNYIIDHLLDAVYSLIERILNTTEDLDLHRYTLIKMAASRERELTDMLYRMAGICPRKHIPNYVEAIELTLRDERDTILEMLERRKE